jgi:hypothetical protein
MSKKLFVIKSVFMHRLYGHHLLISAVVVLLLVAGLSPVFLGGSLNSAMDVSKDGSLDPFINPRIRCPMVEEEWNRTFGGSNIDVGYAVQQVSDGGFVITGYTRSYGAAGHNIWLLRTDVLGGELWNRTFGGGSDEEAESVQQTSDDGFIIAGWTKSYGAGMKDVWLIKTDSAGNEQWNKLFGGTNDDGAASVQQTADGGYIIAGYTSSFGAGSVDVWLIKTDASGNQVWNKPLGGYSSDGAWCVSQTTDGGYILTGWTWSYGQGLGDVWLVKTDEVGNQQWSKTFGGGDADRGYYVSQTADGGYIITGYTGSFGAGLDDVLLIRTDASGNEQWMKTFGGTGREYGYAVEQTSDDGFIIAGYTLSFGAGSEDIWVIKTDASGDEVWSQTFGGPYSDEGFSVQQTVDSGYIVTGHTLSYGAGVHDVWLIKIEGAGVPPLEVDAGGPYEGVVDDPIQIIGTVTGGVPPYMFSWDLGDNTTADEQSPSHVYTMEGAYEVTFMVVDDMGTQASDTAIVTIRASETIPPTVAITTPLAKSLYIGGGRVLPFPFTLVIGSLDVAVDATDTESGVSSVAFFLNGEPLITDTTPPYSWAWTDRGFGRYTILVEAVDGAGNHATDEIIVWRVF